MRLQISLFYGRTKTISAAAIRTAAQARIGTTSFMISLRNS